MSREVNVDSIRVLEKRIRESNGDTIKLKRTRNSLLNISTRVPPEILGHIFTWIVFRERHHPLGSKSYFDGLRKGSYNFLLVCHHWFKVASRTPELWSFWGNTLWDWKKRCRHPGATPVDLVLDGWASRLEATLDGPLRDALRDRSMQDKIRQIHIDGCGSGLLASIISSLTPDGGVQNKCIESIILPLGWDPTIAIAVSDFLARVRLPNLRHLNIAGLPSWDHLTSQTTRLTALSLQPTLPPLDQTTSSLISILASNPNLRELALSNPALPEDASGSVPRVPLRHLKTISLNGEFHHVFGLLHQLELPTELDSVKLSCRNSTVEDISQTLGPYMQDLFRHDTRFQDRLEIATSFWCGYVGISVGVLDDHLDQTFWSKPKSPLASFRMFLTGPPPPRRVMERLHIGLMPFTPQEFVVRFIVRHRLTAPEDLFVAMPKIELLWLQDVHLSDRFLQRNSGGPHSGGKLFPSLRSLRLENVGPDEIDWNILKAYLVHQTSDDQPISLWVSGRNHFVPPEVKNWINDLVEDFHYCQVCGCGCSVNVEEEEEEEEGSEEDEGGEDAEEGEGTEEDEASEGTEEDEEAEDGW